MTQITETTQWVCVQSKVDGQITCFADEDHLQNYLNNLPKDLAAKHSRNIMQADGRFKYTTSKWNGEEYEVDFELAKLDTLERLRAQRPKAFEDLDTQFMINLEKGLDNTEVIAKKEKLRTITDKVALCTTIDQLAALSVDKL